MLKEVQPRVSDNREKDRHGEIGCLYSWFHIFVLIDMLFWKTVPNWVYITSQFKRIIEGHCGSVLWLPEHRRAIISLFCRADKFATCLFTNTCNFWREGICLCICRHVFPFQLHVHWGKEAMPAVKSTINPEISVGCNSVLLLDCPLICHKVALPALFLKKRFLSIAFFPEHHSFICKLNYTIKKQF